MKKSQPKIIVSKFHSLRCRRRCCMRVWFAQLSPSIYTMTPKSSSTNNQEKKISLDFSIFCLFACIFRRIRPRRLNQQSFYLRMYEDFSPRHAIQACRCRCPDLKTLIQTDRQTHIYTQREKERRRKSVRDWDETKRNETHFCQSAFIWQNEHKTVPHNVYIRIYNSVLFHLV